MLQRVSRVLATLSVVAIASHSPAHAQIEKYDTWGLPFAKYGDVLTAVGDIDLDGVPDWTTSDRLVDGFFTEAGRVWVHSGADGTLIKRLDGTITGDYFGTQVIGLDDVDGDGHPELAISGYATGYRIDIYSVLDETALFSIGPPLGANAWGSQLFRVEDVTGDGIAEFAVTDPGTPSIPDRVWIHDGSHGGELYALATPDGQYGVQFGLSVASAGDLDGDGLSEILVGAPFYCINCVHIFAGGVFVYRGSDGTLLRSHHAGEGTVEELGARVVGVGDANGDGVSDYAAQANYPNEYVRLYSGLDGALLHQYQFAQGGSGTMGYALEAMGDLDGNGAPELVVIPRIDGDEPFALIASCAPPFGEVERIHGRFNGGNGQWLIASPGDLTADGTPDLLFGEPSFIDHFAPDYPDNKHIGRVAFVALDERSVDAQRECTPTDNSTGLSAGIWYRGSLALSDDTLELLAWNLPLDQFGIVYHGPNATEFPFGNGLRCVGGTVTRLAPTNSGSNGIVEVPLPAGLAPVPGVTRRFQYWFRDPDAGGAGFDLSDVVALIFAP